MDPKDYPEDAARIIASQARAARDAVAAAIKVDNALFQRKKDGLGPMLEKLNRIKAEMDAKTIEGTAAPAA